MSVPTWRRSESQTEYLYQIFKFTIRIAEICTNKLTESGKVLMRPTKENFKRRRQNLRSQRRLIDGGIMTTEQIKQSYQTWRNYAIQSGASKKSIQSMDRYFTNLFGKENL